MYAIIETGGKQYRVQPGDTIDVERLSAEPGSTLELRRVLMVGGDGVSPTAGAPTVPGAVVRAEVVEHPRGEKIIVFRFKAKVRYRRKTGHRQELTRLRITDIEADGQRRATAATPVSTTSQVTPAPVAAPTPEPAPVAATTPEAPAAPAPAPAPVAAPVGADATTAAGAAGSATTDVRSGAAESATREEEA